MKTEATILAAGIPDTTPLPAPGASAVWRYKGIYRLHDQPVGQWSDVASISVMG